MWKFMRINVLIPFPLQQKQNARREFVAVAEINEGKLATLITSPRRPKLGVHDH
jgi:hypothetical protein